VTTPQDSRDRELGEALAVRAELARLAAATRPPAEQDPFWAIWG
jgi:hypothetical protein